MAADLTCCVCANACDGSSPRSSWNKGGERNRQLVLAPEVPRSEDGRVLLCHTCQRQVWLHQGFLQFLAKKLKREAMPAVETEDGIRCPYCGGARISAFYPRRNRRVTYACNAKGCRKQFSPSAGTVFEWHMLPKEKLLAMKELFASGHTVKAVSVKVGVSYCSALAWRRKFEPELGPPDTKRGPGVRMSRRKRQDGTYWVGWYDGTTGKRISEEEAARRRAEWDSEIAAGRATNFRRSRWLDGQKQKPDA